MKSKNEIILTEVTPDKPDGGELALSVYENFVTAFTNSLILFAEDEQGQEVVVKFSTYEWGAKNEWRGLLKADQANIPVPKPIALVKDAGGTLGIVTRKIDGENLYKSRRRDDGLKRKLGTVIRDMHHRITISGHNWVQSGKSDFTYYDIRINEWKASGVDDLRADSKAQVILAALTKETSNMFADILPVFNHNDLHDDQVLVSRNQDIFLIDVEMWREECAFNDLATYLFHSLRTERPEEDYVEFLDSYRGGEKLSSDEQSMMAFYLLYLGLRGIHFFAKFKPQNIYLAQQHLRKVLRFLEKEMPWR